MSQQLIINSGVGDSLYDAATKINANFTELYVSAPNAVYSLYDDFDFDTTVGVGVTGRTRMTTTVSGIGAAATVNKTVATGIRGTVKLTSGTGASAYASMYSTVGGTTSTLGVILGNEPFTFITYLKNTGAAATDKTITVGLAENYDTPAKGIYFQCVNTGTWNSITNDGTAASRDTTIAQSASFVQFKIVSTGTQVKFYIAGNLVQTHTTNIPSTGMKLIFKVQIGASGVSKDMEIDYYYLMSAVTR